MMKKNIPTRREYRGKWYTFYRSYQYKRDAIRTREQQKTLGYLAHIIKIGDDYCVYMRQM